ncbi:MAG: ferritin-like domain-containing protein [Terriglobales bacterium]
MAGEFIADVEQIRARARRDIERGAVTAAYEGDPRRAAEILNSALATEIVCVLRYRHHYFMASGMHGESIAREFLKYAQEEQAHADAIANRIQQLGGSPELNPAVVSQRAYTQYAAGESLADMIREDLIAERIVVDVYSQLIRHFQFHDNTTREMLEDILKEEEHHADELADLLFTMDPKTGESTGRDPASLIEPAERAQHKPPKAA